MSIEPTTSRFFFLINVPPIPLRINYITDSRSVSCPKPVRNIFGHLHSIENIGGKQHVVRLLEFIPGELLKDVPRSESLFYQLGEFVANLDNKLQVNCFMQIDDDFHDLHI